MAELRPGNAEKGELILGASAGCAPPNGSCSSYCRSGLEPGRGRGCPVGRGAGRKRSPAGFQSRQHCRAIRRRRPGGAITARAGGCRGRGGGTPGAETAGHQLLSAGGIHCSSFRGQHTGVAARAAAQPSRRGDSGGQRRGDGRALRGQDARRRPDAPCAPQRRR